MTKLQLTGCVLAGTLFTVTFVSSCGEDITVDELDLTDTAGYDSHPVESVQKIFYSIMISM